MIYLGADHRGYLLKEKIKELLLSQSQNLTDLGPTKIIPDDDFPIISIKLAETVVKKHGDIGILICGSGAGTCVAANKIIGARATLGFSIKQIKAAKNDDNVNILCLSCNHLDDETNLEIATEFVNSIFIAEDRHIRRLKQISDYELQKC
ncbi:ribose-5-phosphate isomerase [Candidatus Shapirobacteria bacterium CG_4_8_14_3_um_filter_35_11]|uniref:Ribose-5-phosphate isomerase n=4 Tax=Candidatus Shapironibacteriota TaxID=1752721 RepID=A0A2M7XNC4_9BACT|nr:MAG: ribose-5-phosphate isomerase [Candidatus Shapirobacteria bacterium CG03_land_8_20_14_0_80_35_14]PIX68201.1 MAG: ribose-5-phosphate isomerase [Candidatus Shapirobacteria bacterium CG_4_10_14_3_um_filter_35_13]PJA50912.1 MAG: ribose-5-phosphate isomerase [Candidatus Shapirobacteria bacterium CG_4_9_14_3_um_filter_36_12]PJC80980.1 MAG: ribose-5-phosphate isomerase [Candidatus Shapirobacteria bacterium CG_4_8_14_3_um_filter_35_11]